MREISYDSKHSRSVHRLQTRVVGWGGGVMVESWPPLATKFKSLPYFLADMVLIFTLLLLFCRDSSLSSLRGLIRGGIENSVDSGASPGASLTSPSSALGTPATAALQVLMPWNFKDYCMCVCTCQKCNCRQPPQQHLWVCCIISIT
jgi:hypothetical protein